MGIAHFGNYTDNRLPMRPLLSAYTRKKWSCGSMVNGVHIPRMEPFETTLDVFDIRNVTIHCRSCGRALIVGEVAGDASSEAHGWHCSECIIFPDGDLTAWHITYPMQRKSRKNPTGTKSLFIVHFAYVADDYINRLHEIFGKVELEQINIIKIIDAENAGALKGVYQTNLIERKAQLVGALNGQTTTSQRAELIQELLQVDMELGKLGEST